jgi:hypothetical protein
MDDHQEILNIAGGRVEEVRNHPRPQAAVSVHPVRDALQNSVGIFNTFRVVAPAPSPNPAAYQVAGDSSTPSRLPDRLARPSTPPGSRSVLSFGSPTRMQLSPSSLHMRVDALGAQNWQMRRKTQCSSEDADAVPARLLHRPLGVYAFNTPSAGAASSSSASAVLDPSHTGRQTSTTSGSALRADPHVAAVLELQQAEEDTAYYGYQYFPLADIKEPVGYRLDAAACVSHLCALCSQWVPSASETVNYQGNFDRHINSKACQKGARLLLAKLARRPSQQLHATPHAPAQPVIAAPMETPARAAASPSCPGVVMHWPGDVHSTYPWHQHSTTSRCSLAWTFPLATTPSGPPFRVWSCVCRRAARGTAPCSACVRVQDQITKKHATVSNPAPAKKTPDDYLSRMQMNVVNSRLRENLESRDLEVRAVEITQCVHSTCACQIFRLREQAKGATRKVKDLERLMLLISTHDIPRLRHIIELSLKQKRSLSYIVDRLEQAIDGVYKATGQHTDWEMDLALLVYRLGGWRLLWTMIVTFNLPSIRTLKRKVNRVTVRPCLRATDDETVSENIQNVVLKPRAAQPSWSYLYHLAWDETAINALSFFSRLWNSVGGLCGPCTPLSQNLTLNSVRTIDEIVEGLFPADHSDPRLHFATQGSVVVLVPHGRDNHCPQVISVTGMCGKKDATASAEGFRQLIRVAETSGLAAKYGYPSSIATDGDAARRKGGYAVFLSEDIDPVKNQDLWERLRGCVGLNLKVGPHLVTLDLDWKHIIKRKFANLRLCLC